MTIQSIPSFRNPPFNVNDVIIKAGTPDYLTVYLLPNSSTQADSEYGIQVNNRDTGTARAQIKAIWNAADIQSKRQLSLVIKATPDEVKNHPLITAYWDGWYASTQSQDFSVAYTFSLLTLNGLTEQQSIDKQNQAQQTLYQQQLAMAAQQKQEIKNQQDMLNADYLKRLSEKNAHANQILLIFIPIDSVLFIFILILVFLYFIRPRTTKPEGQEVIGQTVEDQSQARNGTLPLDIENIPWDPKKYPSSSNAPSAEQTATSSEFDNFGGRLAIPKKIRDGIIQRSENRCENPDCRQFPIHIHHIDSNRRNNNKENLIALCPTCHNDASNGKLIPSQLRMWAMASYGRLRQRRGY